MTAPAQAAPSPDHIGPWALERVLGRGGAGTVFAGRDIAGRPVAIKVPDEGGVRAAWLVHEARFASRLRHPHIVQLQGSGQLADGRPYLVYELIEGRSLEDCAEQLSAREVVRIGGELLAALAYAHDAGVLHLDLSPANVLLDAEGSTKLTDFGLAMSDDRRARSATRRALVAGTPGYLSPEQAIGSGGVGPRADVYGAGALLYRLIAGYPPHFGADNTEIIRRTVHGEPLPLSPRPGLLLGDAACTLVERMLSRDPEERPASAAQARREWLDAADALFLLRDGPPSAPTPAAPIRRPAASLLATQLDVEGDAPTADVRFTRTTRKRTAPEGEAALPRQLPPIGREALLAELDRLPAEPGPIWVVGAPGAGVSHVLDRHVQRLGHADAVVARCTARRGMPSLPVEPLAALMLDLTDGFGLPVWAGAERVLASLSQLGDPQELEQARMALSGALLGAGHPATAAALMECFRAALLYRRGARPLALVIDDADQIDPGSEEVLRRLAANGVRVILGGVAGRATDRQLQVPALPPAEAAALAAAAGARAPARAAEALEGLPGPIVAFARFDAPDPRRAALDSLGTEARALLKAAALFGGAHVPLRALPDIAATAGAPRDLPELGPWLPAVPQAAARLEAWARLADPTLATQLTPDGAMRERAVRWLARECRDQSYGVQALTAELAGAAGQPARAAYAAAEAGRRAAACDAPEAGPLLERALAYAEEAPEAVDRAAVLATLAELDIKSSTSRAFARAAEVLDEALPERKVLRARARRLQAKARMDERRAEEALALIDDGIELLGDHPDPQELAELLSSKGWVLGYLCGDNDAGIAFGRQALAVAAQVDTPAFRARLCGRLGANQLRAGDWNGQLATNLRDLGLSGIAHDVSGLMRAHINIGVCYTNRGLLALARAHTEEAAHLATAHGELRAGQIAWNNLALIAADEERWADAEAAAARSFELCPSEAHQLSETWEVLFRARIGRGDTEGAAEALAGLEARATGAERALVVRAQVRQLDPGPATALLRSLLGEGVGDPYERARTELALASALRAGGEDAEAEALERAADAVLSRLGANVRLERRRNPRW